MNKKCCKRFRSFYGIFVNLEIAWIINVVIKLKLEWWPIIWIFSECLVFGGPLLLIKLFRGNLDFLEAFWQIMRGWNNYFLIEFDTFCWARCFERKFRLQAFVESHSGKVSIIYWIILLFSLLFSGVLTFNFKVILQSLWRFFFLSLFNFFNIFLLSVKCFKVLSKINAFNFSLKNYSTFDKSIN